MRFSCYDERNEELYRAFLRAYSREDVRNHDDAIRIAMNSPCSRFWVSFDYAYREITSRIKKREWNSRRKVARRKEAYDMIYAKYLELKDKREFRGKSVKFIASFAINSTAPSFFISFTTAKEIIYKINKRRKLF